ncbi:hypothetical protein HPB52_001284 [Rhipicephalus sanguineus]|uniref:Uncharacterized protein n=1 Tax=Rhipicephalus sanguineus TaxID=34632 RepID=A0A9D4Q3L1_RHISA|nr:hypothetical protein HPB52_001284 [Rhipicephalus sanguineus]
MHRPGHLAFKGQTPCWWQLSHNSTACCWNQDNYWNGIEDSADQEVATQGTDAVTLEGLKSLYNCCFT